MLTLFKEMDIILHAVIVQVFGSKSVRYSTNVNDLVVWHRY